MIKTESNQPQVESDFGAVRFEAHDHAEMQRANVNPIVLPSAAAAWFSLDEVHDIEKDSMPEFFNASFPSKNAKTYKEYRNFMVLLYRQNPAAYLTATSKWSSFS